MCLYFDVCKTQKRKDYALWRQFNEKPSVILGCPGLMFPTSTQIVVDALTAKTGPMQGAAQDCMY